MTWQRQLVGLLALALIGIALWRLESVRGGLEIHDFQVGEIPVTLYRLPGPPSPLVVVSHGFAGSRQMMEAYSLTLAQAGYLVLAFDYAGHGQNRLPMMGDVTSVDGVTQQLIEQTQAVIEAGLAMEFADGRIALLGHSMASDIIARTAIAEPRVQAVVAVSMYSEAVSATEPARLLMITGEWEPGLRQAAVEALRLVDPEAREGETVSDENAGTLRRAVVAPKVEHVAVLYSATALEEARTWLDRTFARGSESDVASTGPWILLLLGGVVMLAWPLAGLFSARGAPTGRISRPWFLAAILVPATAAPLMSVVALPFAKGALPPVLVADYMALHFLIYGLLQLILLWRAGADFGRLRLLPALCLTVYGIALFGGALDRYAANFMPHEGRLALLAAIALGAIPFMLADGLVTEGSRAALWRRMTARLAILLSFGIALTLDFEGLFFLILVLPVVVLFFIIFGMMGRWLARRSGPSAAGFGLGLILAWSLAVTFPLLDTDGSGNVSDAAETAPVKP